MKTETNAIRLFFFKLYLSLNPQVTSDFEGFQLFDGKKEVSVEQEPHLN